MPSWGPDLVNKLISISISIVLIEITKGAGNKETPQTIYIYILLYFCKLMYDKPPNISQVYYFVTALTKHIKDF